MSEGGEAYTTDIVYPSAFGAFQAPAHLAQAAWMGGRRAPRVDDGFAYADLGCGAGLTICVLADCYPEAEFHGVDVNPQHIAQGRELAARAGLKNVVFHEASFADLDRLPLPNLRFIGLSGVYSWLPPELRQACMAFAADRLEAEGAVFLHYAALPGNAQIDALYALVRETARTLPGDSVQRFRAACAMVRRLHDAEARFFRANPLAAAWLTQFDKQDVRSMAHEVLNAQTASLSVRDAADEAARHGLMFVANAQLELNDLQLTAPDALREDLAAAAPLAREMLMDAIRNTHSRMDVLMRAAADPGPAPPFWAGRLTRGSMSEARRDLGRRTGLDLLTAEYDAILSLTDGQAVRLPDLLNAPQVNGDGSGEDRVKRLIALKLVNLLRTPYAPVRLQGVITMTSRLNQLVLEDQIDSSGPAPFASRVAGNQVLMPPQDRLALLHLVGGDFSAAWRRIAAAGQTARAGGRLIDGPKALAAAAAERAEALGPAMIQTLAALDIIH
jgi:hypothetical protein